MCTSSGWRTTCSGGGETGGGGGVSGYEHCSGEMQAALASWHSARGMAGRPRVVARFARILRGARRSSRRSGGLGGIVGLGGRCGSSSREGASPSRPERVHGATWAHGARCLACVVLAVIPIRGAISQHWNLLAALQSLSVECDSAVFFFQALSASAQRVLCSAEVRHLFCTRIAVRHDMEDASSRTD